MTFWGKKYRNRNQISSCHGLGTGEVDYEAMGEISGVMELFYIVIVMVDKSICPN